MNHSRLPGTSVVENPVEVFVKSWRVYREIIDNNYMFHREISEAVKLALTESMTKPMVSIIDLGCGDASMILPLLNRDQVGQYVGFDLSPSALDMAGEALSAMGIKHHLCCNDMLEGIRTLPDESQDLVFSSYALHHLSVDQKEAIIREIARVLLPGGHFVLIDIFREPDESRTDYLTHYMDRLRSDWLSLAKASAELVIDHATRFDFPENTEFYVVRLRDEGFKSCRRLAKQTWHEAWIFERPDI